MMGCPEHRAASAVQELVRAANFWARAAFIYGAYKTIQVKEALLRMSGHDEGCVTAMWRKHHAWAGQQMYDLCVQLRGFYVKAGQFIGARADVVPMEVCQPLSLLHDQVMKGNTRTSQEGCTSPDSYAAALEHHACVMCAGGSHSEATPLMQRNCLSQAGMHCKLKSDRPSACCHTVLHS